MTVSGLVERLEGKGLVVRVTDPNDSRAKIVKITDKATAMVTEMKRLADDVYAEVFDGVTEADRQTAMKVLQRMSANLSKQRAPGKEELV
jgi:DNA-binding MarR family transcriptional regulator